MTSESRGWYAAWSPDGQQIAFSSPGGINPQVASARGAGQTRSLRTSDIPMYISDWSRDGKHLAYTESRPDTSNDVWLLPMTGEGKPSGASSRRRPQWHSSSPEDGEREQRDSPSNLPPDRAVYPCGALKEPAEVFQIPPNQPRDEQEQSEKPD